MSDHKLTFHLVVKEIDSQARVRATLTQGKMLLDGNSFAIVHNLPLIAHLSPHRSFGLMSPVGKTPRCEEVFYSTYRFMIPARLLQQQRSEEHTSELQS